MDPHGLANDRLKKDGSNADTEIDIGSEALTTTGLGMFGNLDVDTLNFNGNVISDSTGTILFSGTVLDLGANDILNVNEIKVDIISFNFADTIAIDRLFIDDDITISSGLITSTSGTISFDNENLITSGNVTIDSDASALILGDGQDASIVHNGTDLVFDILQATTRVVFNPGGDDTDFLFGSAQLEDVGTAAQDERMFFDKEKGAFRAGKVNDAKWDADNVGDQSVAFGSQTTASGNQSTALGLNTTASGFYSLSCGLDSVASGVNSVAIGDTVVAGPATHTFAFGDAFTNNTANSFAVGFGSLDFMVTATQMLYTGTAKLGDGGTTNYAQFGTDGSLTLVGTARVRKEIEITAVSIAPGASGVTLTTNGLFIGEAFGINDDMHALFEVPHDWATGTNFEIKVYWYIDEAYGVGAEVQWQITWAACPTNASEPIDNPTHTGTIDFGDQNIPATAKFLTKTPAGTIAGGSLSVSDVVALNVSRVALDGGTNPTAEPVMIRLEIDYLSDKLGEAT